MGRGKPSKPVTLSVIPVNPSSPAVVSGNEDETEEMSRLVENIRIVSEQMKQDVKSNPKIPSGLCESLLNDLESLNSVSNPQRMHVCYVVGSTCAGKSNLINKISNTNKCKVSDMLDAGTRTFEIVCAKEVNTVFVDTIGFGSELDDSDLVRTFEKQQNLDGLPDSILLVVTQEQLRNRASLKNVIDYINKVVRRVRNVRHNTSVPIICVLNKIDLCFPDGLSDSEDCRQKIAKLMEHALKIVNQFLKTKATLCVVTSTTKNYGIEELRCSINAQSPLHAQMINNDLEYMRKHRWIIANKIIAGFSTASAAVSLLPIADIFIVTILQYWMYRMLACLSTDPNRTPDTFDKEHAIATRMTFVVRAGASIVGAIFQLSLIGYFVGSGVCVTAAASSTAALGWTSYYYFIGETSPEEHEECK